MLNAYVCPYKTRVREIIKGTCFTVAAWSVALAGFAVFLRFGNTGRLYGAISTLIVFLLWLYVLSVCFVAVAGITMTRELVALIASGSTRPPTANTLGSVLPCSKFFPSKTRKKQLRKESH